jgi:hypothetical protein
VGGHLFATRSKKEGAKMVRKKESGIGGSEGRYDGKRVESGTMDNMQSPRVEAKGPE